MGEAGGRASGRVPDFVVHDKGDSVGVVVVEDVEAGAELSGWVLGTDETMTVRALEAVPLGHKVALVDLEAGKPPIKYGQEIGRMVAPVKRGGYVHVHNLKTARW